MLGSSRTDVAADSTLLRNTVAALRKLAIDGLVAIGGDDMVRSALAIERESGGRIKVVMVPKTIDNDLALPEQITTRPSRAVNSTSIRSSRSPAITRSKSANARARLSGWSRSKRP